MKWNDSRQVRRMGVATVTVGALALVGCGGDGGGDDGERTLVLALSGETQSFDPALQVSEGDQTLRWHAVFDTLLHCEADGTVVPKAAEDYELNEDSTELTMTLRDDMTFSDGTPVDAEAAAATIRHMQESGGSDAGRVAGIEIETPDEHTLVLTAPEPTGVLPTFMCMAPGAIAHPEQLESGDVANDPYSSGPYELDQAGTTSGSTYRLVKREDYWDADNYAYDVIELRVMAEATARLNALISGQIDGALINQEQADEAEGADVHLLTFPAAWSGLYLNDRDGETVPALEDIRVRQAINMAFDREQLAENTYRYDAIPTTQIVHPDSPAYMPELNERYPYDLDAAQELMEEAGYEDGFELEVPSQSGASAEYNPIVIQQLAELNIEVTEVPVSGPTALDDILGGRFPVMYSRMGTNADAPKWISDYLEPDSIWNVMDTEDSELEPLLEEAQYVQDEDAEEVFRDINEYIVEEAWYAPWVVETGFFAIAEPDLVPEMNDPWNLNPTLQDFE